MREIKFRAWFGDKIIKPMSLQKMIHQKDNTIPLKVLEKEIIFMQYTGLEDRNGVEIYEGDIVNFQHIDDYGYMTNVFQNGFYRGVVKWGEHYPGFDIFDIKDNSTFGFDCNIFSMESDIVIEIIGNIYENKELLNTDG